jgi:hypothetical protein
MLKRNWDDLSRKLVDRYDMLYSFDAVQASLGEYALNYFGFGVLKTAMYPTPFPITMSGVSLGGSVGNGISFDPNGFITRIDTASPTSKNFTITAADPALDRWDLLVIRYKATGDTPVPKPSDPILTVDLNIHDDFELAVIPGTPSLTPAYPAKGTLDIILCGLKVPALATLGTQVVVDLGVRDIAVNDIVESAVFKQEIPAEASDGVNQDFTLTSEPASVGSLLVSVNGVALKNTEWSILGLVVTLAVAPEIGQEVYFYYITKSVSSINPLVALQETPTGTVDGINDTFYLTGRPAAQAPTIVFVDGLMVTADKWSLVQNLTQFSILFAPGSIPESAQEIYCYYLVDSDTIGIPPVAPGGGDGAFVVLGSMSLPAQIDPTVGVPVTADQRQMKFISSQGGVETITANPQIAAGTIVGQELELVGTSDTNYSILNDGNGLALNGAIQLKRHSVIALAWDGSDWFERNRR